jgi:hypothetical protein
MSKKELWIRLAIYITFSLLVPVAFLIWRFQLFTKTDGVAVGGWGIVAICFVVGFFGKLLKTIRKGMEQSLATQIIDGIVKVILPLFIGCFACYYLQDVIEQVFQFLCVLIVCEMIGIIANPLPMWYKEHPVEGSGENLISYLIELLKKVNGDEK